MGGGAARQEGFLSEELLSLMDVLEKGDGLRARCGKRVATAIHA